jgi:D-alanyl-D-alanine carboxypeptidase/D-alanyl-D-alanine-endopeptidase (penicillin-binding protein 4)
MAPRERRRTTASAARIALLLLANGLCLYILYGMLAGDLPSLEAAEEAEEPVLVAAAPSAAAPQLAASGKHSGIDRGLQAKIASIVERYQTKAARDTKGKVSAGAIEVGVHVREAGAGGALVALQADRAMRPASNLKLVTSAAALVLMGVDAELETRFEAGGPIVNGVLEGDLIVRAGADPLYDREAGGSIDRFVIPVARELKAAGIERVRGQLVLDERDYLRVGPGPAWPPANQHWTEFCARAGGFSANAGCLTALVRPGREGGAALVSIEPAGHGLDPHYSAKTGSARSKLNIRVEAREGSINLGGEIPRSTERYSVRFAAPDPVALFGHALCASLREQGVRIEGGIARERNRESARTLARLRTPIRDLLVPINTWSNNACADQLFLALGHAHGGGGTREGGARATRAALDRLGVSSAGLVQVDGSGLSRDNRVNAAQITALIEAVLRRGGKTAIAYVDSLAVAGMSGTLEHRTTKGNLRAKTGFIAGTSALSGLVESADGRTLVFSILVDYPRFEGLNRSCWKPMEDEIVSALANSKE